MKLDDLAREIDLIKNNHLAHMAEDIDRLDKRLEKMDNRVWAILILLVGAVVLTFIKN
jgi:polyhydroxyalkanoate synthesis regulator phasin